MQGFNSIPNIQPNPQNIQMKKPFNIEKKDINNFTVGALLSYGLLETKNKYSLLKNKNGKSLNKLKISARLNTVKNVFKGAILGVLISAAAKFLLPLLEPYKPQIKTVQQNATNTLNNIFNSKKS